MVYINGLGSISVQTDETLKLPNWGKENYLRSIEPEFSKFISPVLSRRMSKIIKKSIVSSLLCLKDSNVEMPEAIISGTGLGCIEDTEKFLRTMISQKESFLQPTHFIQSTHNTISSQIALNLKCYSYNNTYSHLGISFESALLDGFIQIKTNQIKNALIGGFDEMTPDYKFMLSKVGFWKKEPFSIQDMKEPKTYGTVAGEGCSSILLSDEKTDKSYAKIDDILIFHTPKNKQTTTEIIIDFLSKNNTNISEIDAVMLGLNGDLTNDLIYDAIYTKPFSKEPHLIFKHLSGEFFTSSGFGTIMASKLIKDNTFSNLLYRKYHPTNPIKKILFHNHYNNVSHALILLSKC